MQYQALEELPADPMRVTPDAAPCKRCGAPRPRKSGQRYCFGCARGTNAKPRSYRLPEGATAPCKRCGAPRPRRRGKRFCDDCTLHRLGHRRATADPDEREVLLTLHSWGIPLTLDETAIALGMSREWVRVLQKSALHKLREAVQEWAQ